MQNPLVYVVPKWTELCARDFKEGSERLCEVISKGETKIYNFDDDQDPNLDDDELTDSREIFWQRDSIVAKLEPPSTAIVEALRQRQFEDWVSGDAEAVLSSISCELLGKMCFVVHFL